MGKIVKSVLMIAAAVAIIVFATPIAGALVPVLGAVGIAATSAAISSALVGVALSVALSSALSLFQKTPNLSQSLGDRQGINPDPVAPRKIVFGQTAAGTDVRFREAYGKNSDRESYVFALASHKLNSVKTVSMDDTIVWNSAQNGANGNDVQGNKYDDGYDEVFPVLEGSTSNGRNVGTGTYWNTSSTFTGCSYLVITYRLDKQKVWANGMPSKITTVVEGCPIYDPRADSTNGGSGAMRPGTQSTWRYYNGSSAIGRNPALCLLTYLIGYRINGVLAWGMGLPVDAIDMGNFIQYANLCEEQVQAADGSNVQRYTCDGIFSTTDSHQTIINSICVSMGTAILVDTDGLFGLIEGYDDTMSPAFALGPDDLLSPGLWSPSPPVRERVTRITGRFADPTQGYALNSWGSINVDPFADGIPRVQTTDFGCVSRPQTAQRIAKQMLVKSKYSGTYSGVFGPRFFACPVGSLVSLTGPQGFNGKLFRVVSSEETFDLTFQAILREESAEVYEWDKSEEKALPANILQSTFDPVSAEAVLGLTVSAAAQAGANGVSTVFVAVDWTPAASLRTTSIEIQAQLPGATVWTTEAERFDPRAGHFTFGAGVSGAGIVVQARYRMDNGAYGPWSSTQLASTPTNNTNDWNAVYGNGKPENGATNGAPSGSPFGTTTVDDFISRLVDVEGDLTELQQDVQNGTSPDLTQLKQDVADAKSKLDSVAQTVKSQQSSISGNTSAIQTEQGARTNADTALSGRIDTLSTNYSNLSSSIQTESVTRANAVSSLATQVTSVQAYATSRPNLQPNGGFTNKDLSGAGSTSIPSGGVVITDNQWGNLFHHTNSGAQALWMPYINVQAGDTITASWDYSLIASAGTTRVDAVYYTSTNGSGTQSYGASSPNYDRRDFTDDFRVSYTFTVPSNCKSIKMRFVSENVSGATEIGFRRLKVERGNTASSWSDKGADAQTAAAITNEASARASADSAISSNVSSLTSRMGSAEATISSQGTTLTNHTSSISSLNYKVSAIAPVVQNLLKNPTFDNGSTTAWTNLGGDWKTNGSYDEAKYFGTGGTAGFNHDPIIVSAGAAYSLQMEAWTPGLRGGRLNLDLMWLDNSNNVISYSNRCIVTANSGTYTRYTYDGQGGNLVAPNGAVQAQARVYLESSTVDSGGSVAVRRIQVERSNVANPWTDFTDNAAVQAQVQQNSSAIADITNNKLAAYWQVVATAGSQSASISAIAQSGGTNYSAIELIASQFTVKTGAGNKPVLAVTGNTVVINGNLVATSSMIDNSATNIITVVSTSSFAGDGGGGGSYVSPGGGKNGGQLQ